MWHFEQLLHNKGVNVGAQLWGISLPCSLKGGCILNLQEDKYEKGTRLQCLGIVGFC